MGTLLNYGEKRLNILGINESFLNENYSDHEIKLQGYITIRKDRVGKEGGGLVFYVDEDTAFIRRNEFEVNDIEAIWLEIKFAHTKNLLLCLIYRPPSATVEWINSFHDMINAPYSSFKDIVIMGDFNFNVLREVNKRWENLICHFNLTQMVITPTRVTDSAASLIDHIYTTNEALVKNVDVPQIRLSDHYPVHFSWLRERHKVKKNAHTCITYRAVNKMNEQAFLEDLSNCNWENVTSGNDVDVALTSWENLLLNVVNKHAPKREKRVKKKFQPKWFNVEIRSAIEKRDYAKTNESGIYKYWRNKTTALIRQAKKDFFHGEISKNKGNTKAIWQILRDVQTTDTAPPNCKTSLLHVNGTDITEDNEVANAFNSFFTTISKKYFNSQPQFDNDSLKSLEIYVSSKLMNETRFYIPEVTNDFVFNYLNGLDTKKATGTDEISAHILRKSARCLTPSLTHIINLSIRKSIFPSNWKVAKITPIFKCGIKAEVSNYIDQFLCCQ